MKNMMIIVALVAISIIGVLFINNLNSDQHPKTKLEEFSKKTGDTYIIGFEKIGTINGRYGASITVKAKELMNVAKKQKYMD